MLYNHDDTAFSHFIKQLVFWLSLIAMFSLFIFILTSDTDLPQQKMIVELDIKDKINICAPLVSEEKPSFNHKNYEF